MRKLRLFLLDNSRVLANVTAPCPEINDQKVKIGRILSEFLAGTDASLSDNFADLVSRIICKEMGSNTIYHPLNENTFFSM